MSDGAMQESEAVAILKRAKAEALNKRTWRYDLSVAWSTGAYRRFGWGSLANDLQRVRNQFGGAWLAKVILAPGTRGSSRALVFATAARLSRKSDAFWRGRMAESELPRHGPLTIEIAREAKVRMPNVVRHMNAEVTEGHAQKFHEIKGHMARWYVAETK